MKDVSGHTMGWRDLFERDLNIVIPVHSLLNTAVMPVADIKK